MQQLYRDIPRVPHVFFFFKINIIISGYINNSVHLYPIYWWCKILEASWNEEYTIAIL